jgi:hypothetical protein
MVTTAEQEAWVENWEREAHRFSADVDKMRNEILVYLNRLMPKDRQFYAGRGGNIEYNGGPQNHPIVVIRDAEDIPGSYELMMGAQQLRIDKKKQPKFLVFFGIEGTGIKSRYDENYIVGIGGYNPRDLQKVKRNILTKINQLVLS